MRRRDLLGVPLGAAATALPVAARAQQRRRIGFLSGASADGQEPQLSAFRRGLNQTGYDEGRNLVIEYRWAKPLGLTVPYQMLMRADEVIE